VSLHVVGIGEEGLLPAARALVAAAEVVVGGARHLAMAPEGPERVAWPSPFDTSLLDGLRIGAPSPSSRATRSGSRPARPSRGRVPTPVLVPHVSAFQLAAARMRWPLAEAECLSVHGRPVEAVLPLLHPGARLLLLAEAGSAPGLAGLLARRGWGGSRVTALWHMGGPEEGRREALARGWSGDTPALATLAVECVPDPGARPLPRWGLPDEAFAHDGTMTKREVRALTLARLAPRPGALLWDVGCGCGSVAVEWTRAARGARAVGIEPRADRRAFAAANALALGAPSLRLVAGEAPGALAGLPAPDATFLGGGLSEEAFAACWAALRPHGRLVANAVTLESQALLMGLHARHGGDLVRLAVSRAEPVGGRTAWRPAMEVVQWALTKGGA
jgi:precorrin-6Y C5,15-methyltransferase (decarboxylating)